MPRARVVDASQGVDVQPAVEVVDDAGQVVDDERPEVFQLAPVVNDPPQTELRRSLPVSPPQRTCRARRRRRSSMLALQTTTTTVRVGGVVTVAILSKSIAILDIYVADLH